MNSIKTVIHIHEHTKHSHVHTLTHKLKESDDNGKCSDYGWHSYFNESIILRINFQELFFTVRKDKKKNCLVEYIQTSLVKYRIVLVFIGP